MIRFDKDALFDTFIPFNYGYSDFKKELDELIVTLNRQLTAPHGQFVNRMMLLPSYLASKYVYNAITFVRSILDKVIIDPFGVSYIEYAEKFEGIAGNFYDWSRESMNIKTALYPFDNSGDDDFDLTQIEFGESIQELFGPITPETWNPEKKGRWIITVGDREIGSSDRIRRPDTEVLTNDELGKLSTTSFNLLQNETYLITAIWTCLEDIAESLREIHELLSERIEDSQVQEELFLRRRQDYLNSDCWDAALGELYNDIKLLSGVVDEYQLLSNIKVQVYYRLRNNALGQSYLAANCSKYFIGRLFSPIIKISQYEFNEFLKLNCQYRHICKLVDYHSKWSKADDKSMFVNSGVDYIVNALVPYLSSKIGFNSRKSYAALWQAMIDLNLLSKTDAGSFTDWVNDSFLKDAPNDSSKRGKIKNDKSIRGAVDDMYKLQTKGEHKISFKDLTEDEIPQLKNGSQLKNLYRDCILILSKAFDVNLEEIGFQSYITEYSKAKDFLSDFPEDSKSVNIMECFSAYEDFSRRQIIKKR